MDPGLGPYCGGRPLGFGTCSGGGEPNLNTPWWPGGGGGSGGLPDKVTGVLGVVEVGGGVSGAQKRT